MKNKEKTQESLPSIQPLFPQLASCTALSGQLGQGKEILKRLLPENFSSLTDQQARAWFSKNLPLIQWIPIESAPDILSVYFLCTPTQEVKADNVLLQLMKKWLIPEKEVQVLGFNSLYFYMEGHNSHLFFVAEVKILVEDGRDLRKIEEHLPRLSHELSLCLSSAKYFEHCLDAKALSLDQKSTQIQGYLRRLSERTQNRLDIGLFQNMSAFLAISKPDFREVRLAKHLTRIVVTHHLLKKHLLHHLSVTPEKRHLEFRFIRSKLRFPFGIKKVLGLSVAVALSDRYESFEDTHILDAVQKFIPKAQMVKGSFYYYRGNNDPIKYLYLELEKKDGVAFHQNEIQLFNRELGEELKKRVERLVPSVFMIRNEEEVMRNVLILSQELKYLSDLPQVMVNFEKQEADKLYFTVLVIRVLKKHDRPLEELFRSSKQSFQFISDRVQHVGYVRKKNPKEANVFHLCIPKERSLLRANSSVNFYLARQKIVSIMTEALGEVRDYNGGMILKQGELFSQLKLAFSGIAQKDQELLENFFFALNPIEAQATASLTSLKTLYTLILEASQKELSKRESAYKKFTKKKDKMFAVIRIKDPTFESILNEELSQLENFSKSLIRTTVNYQGTHLYGIIYETINDNQQKLFQKIVESSFQKWVSKFLNQQELRLSFLDTPAFLDPRVGGDLTSAHFINMLFEGLTSIDRDSKPILALAKSVDISPDKRKYVFKLRPSFWSNGDPLVAYDFEFAWKKILSPSFYTPFAFFFYSLKNARAAKEGKAELDQVGVKAVDQQTLVVELENSTPEFLQIVSHALYSPVNHRIDQQYPNWAHASGEAYVCNGPMILKNAFPNGSFELVKNPRFWNKNNIKIDRILIYKNNSETAYEMYRNHEIDWIGHPMRPWESYFQNEKEEVLSSKPLGCHWCVFNTLRFPFVNLKMRQAFNFAVNRIEVAKNVPFAPEAAFSPLPLIHTGITDRSLVYGDKKLAVKLFEEALKEMGLTRESFPILTLCLSGGTGREKVAQSLIKQWEEVFGISCRLEIYEFHVLFPKMLEGDFQIGTISWKPWVNDPIYTLGAFQYRNNHVNFPKWENQQYQEILDEAQRESSLEQRLQKLKKAEEILIEESPLIPLHYEIYRYMRKKEIKNAFCSDTGNIDFRWTSIVPN
jgi:oligopeptide transport system substrate-binding protein